MTATEAQSGSPELERWTTNFDWSSEPVYLEQSRRGAPPNVPTNIRLRLPVVRDFRIVLGAQPDGDVRCEFWSRKQGQLLVAFPSRDFQEETVTTLAEALYGIGGADDPLNDVHMGSEVFVWREAGEVLVIHGGDDDSEPGSFRIAFRVPEGIFAEEWWGMLRLARRLQPRPGHEDRGDGPFIPVDDTETLDEEERAN